MHQPKVCRSVTFALKRGMHVQVGCVWRLQVAQQHGILLDPIYSLAAWEAACKLAGRTSPGISRVAMLHTGGSLGLQGLAQRHPGWF